MSIQKTFWGKILGNVNLIFQKLKLQMVVLEIDFANFLCEKGAEGIIKSLGI